MQRKRLDDLGVCRWNPSPEEIRWVESALGPAHQLGTVSDETSFIVPTEATWCRGVFLDRDGFVTYGSTPFLKVFDHETRTMFDLKFLR
jgi:hypothetical protein